ncbi:MAG: MarR family transcriptional regulator [Anaerolineae bacterium]|nr:MarR family transcriptional regulator [Gemmatimonadaceae bacterium]
MTGKSAIPNNPSTHLAIADRVHSAAIHLLRQLRRADDATGLSAPRLSALSVAVFAGPLTLGALAAAEQVRPPTMSRLVDALERGGLVERERDEVDARLIRIRATKKGVSVMRRGRARRVARLAAQLKLLQPAHLVTLGQAAAILDSVVAELAAHRTQ